MRASCTDDTGHGTDGTHRAGIIWRAGSTNRSTPSLLGSELNLTGPFWDFMANFDLNKAGFVIVGIFVLTWVVALSIWRYGGIEQKWEAHTVTAGDRD